MRTTTQTAIHAAINRPKWGRYAARQYALKRGVHPSIYRLVCQLEAAEKVKELSK